MNVPSAILCAVVRLYQLVISPFVPPRCRFQPSCSDYALEALTLHGAVLGGWLALRRFVRCHPWGGWGYDPVPMIGPRRDPSGRRSSA